MAFSDLASNEEVSYLDATTGGFALKDGQSHSSSLEAVEKSVAQTKYHLNPTPMAGYSSNELVPKVDWQPIANFSCSSSMRQLTQIDPIYNNLAEGIFDVGSTSGEIAIDYDIDFSGASGSYIQVWYEGVQIHLVTGLDAVDTGSFFFTYTYNSSTQIRIVYGAVLL